MRAAKRQTNVPTRCNHRRTTLGAAALSIVLLACGSDASISDSEVGEVGLPEVTTTTIEDSSEPTPVALIEECRDVPAVMTDVLREPGSPEQFDPIVLGVLQSYAAEHPDTFGGIWFEPEAFGTLVLAFTDEPGPHVAALLDRAPSPDDVAVMDPRPPIDDGRALADRDDVVIDVVQVPHAETTLRTLQDASVDVLANDPSIVGLGVDPRRSRMTISIDDGRISRTDVAALAQRYLDAGHDPSMLCLDAEIVEGAEPPPPFQIGDELDVITLPGEDGTFPATTRAECRGVRFDLGDLTATVPYGDLEPGLRSVMDAWLSTTGSEGWPQEGWQLLTQSDATATFIAVDDFGAAFVTAELGANGWILAGASATGDCDVRITLPAGLSPVDWELDPAAPPPAADATELRLLATERSCTTGQEMGDRLLAPDVVETDDAVRIVLAAVPLLGDQGCPSNPSTVVTIPLDAPLGDRSVIDGLEVGPLLDLLDG